MVTIREKPKLEALLEVHLVFAKRPFSFSLDVVVFDLLFELALYVFLFRASLQTLIG